MKNYIKKSYSEKIKMRIRICWLLIFIMLVYMVVIGELGLGDSRKMSTLATDVSRFILFGSLLYVIIKIVNLKKLLKNKNKLLIEFETEKDERKQYIHDKSGGIVVDILLILLLFITCTSALYDTVIFNTVFVIFMITIILKMISYIIFNKIY